ncbi:unnamed protein product [Cuscuta epithymum]|uniref:HAT C-terminal dimerisation domain-containing protein n=1 Tax=Cuscuta epithymum TaxID=186058 RepID=A0AAV0EDT2_9ASTE|nr:unnamed protein product [Cuscuta epithymum]
MAASMNLKFDKYWGTPEKMNHMMFLGLILDPRYKMEYVNYCLKCIYNEKTCTALSKGIESTLRRLYKQYHDWAPPPPLAPRHSVPRFTETSIPSQGSRGKKAKIPGVANTNSSSISSLRPSLSLDDSTLLSGMEDMDREYLSSKSSALTLNLNDVDRYLSDRCEPITGNEDGEVGSDHFDILLWWKENSGRYKILSQVARHVLAVPISTVASESAFSTGRRVLDSFRSSLAPRVVESLICSKNWLNAKEDEYNPVVLKQHMDEVEAFEDCYEVVTDEGVLLMPPTLTSSSSSNTGPNVQNMTTNNHPHEPDADYATMDNMDSEAAVLED